MRARATTAAEDYVRIFNGCGESAIRIDNVLVVIRLFGDFAADGRTAGDPASFAQEEPDVRSLR